MARLRMDPLINATWVEISSSRPLEKIVSRNSSWYGVFMLGVDFEI